MPTLNYVKIFGFWFWFLVKISPIMIGAILPTIFCVSMSWLWCSPVPKSQNPNIADKIQIK